MSRDEVRLDGVRRRFHLRAAERRVDAEVDDEIRFHLQCRVDELVRQGLAEPAAQELAAREFGDLAESRRELAAVDRRRVRRARRGSWWDELRRDLAYGARSTLNTASAYTVQRFVSVRSCARPRAVSW